MSEALPQVIPRLISVRCGFLSVWSPKRSRTVGSVGTALEKVNVTRNEVQDEKVKKTEGVSFGIPSYSKKECKWDFVVFHRAVTFI